MENMVFTVTEEEKKTIAKRTEEVVSAAKGNDLRGSLAAYAAANGYTEAEAAELIDNTVIPTVDTYNASCKEAFEGNLRTWIASKMAETVEAQELTGKQEAAYKLGVLEAVRKINAGLVDAEAEVLTEDEKALLEKAELTEEQLAELNEAILDAIENNAMPLYMSAAFEEFLETNADEDEIRLVVNELWNDNNLKYCAATAMVVAHHNGELPSIPAETSASALVIGACQGVDVANVEAKVSTGEIAADVAFEILKVIAAVALTICVGVVLLEALMTLVEVGFIVGAAVLGGGFLGVLLGAALSIAFGGEIVKMAEFWGTKGLDFLGNIADVAYEALKKGAKKLYQFTVERIVPAVKPTLEKAIGFLRETAAKVFSFLRSKTVITAKA